MNNRKYLFAISAIALLTISACGRSTQETSEPSSEPEVSLEVSSEVSSETPAPSSTVSSESSQSQSSQAVDPFLESIKNAAIEGDEEILDEITVVNAEDGVYGNVYT